MIIYKKTAKSYTGKQENGNTMTEGRGNYI